MAESFLSTVKAQLKAEVQAISESEDDLDVDSIANWLWSKVLEPAIKTSYRNGQKEVPKKNPFRK